MTLILGIETSCDETAASVVEDGRHVLSNLIYSQHELHRQYQGVVPEIASRAHLERIGPVIDEALQQADTTLDQIDAVAVGNRPGLIGSLIVGVSAAKAIAWLTSKPLIGVNHVEAHLHAAALVRSTKSKKPQFSIPNPQFPALGLIVSGGHTSLYELSSPSSMWLLGRTIDDAVGEAFDKAAVILGLPYPGGPAIDQLAVQGDPTAYKLPRPLLGPDRLDFSFSGLKTALLYTVRGKPQPHGSQTHFKRSSEDLTDTQRADLAASFQAAAVETLVLKMDRAIRRLTVEGRLPGSLIIGGGVSANSLLRKRAVELGVKHGLDVHIPDLEYCLDNAAMIASLAYESYLQRRFDDLSLPVFATIFS